MSRGVIWMAVLLAVICFEGLGRSSLPEIPSLVFYLAKDVVLASSLFLIGIKSEAVALMSALYGKFSIFLILSIVWTIIQLFNPGQESIMLGALGIRSYWLWWAAPILIASAVQGAEQRNRVAVVLGVFAIFIALYATLQFASPPDAAINSYALFNGESVVQTSYVFSTGRARVAGTFSYIAGFADFAAAAPVILLAVGLDAPLRTRVVTVAGAGLIASTVGMTGSRNGIILCAAGLAVLLFRAGFIRSTTGRWALIAIGLAAAFSFYYSEDAMDGVASRFQIGDTPTRIENELRVLPPIALLRTEYPLFGLGTGMQQSARYQLGFPTSYGQEEEPPRLLVELGAIGYLLFWIARFGLMVALWRASRILKRAGQMAAAGGATALAVLTMFNRIVFDHVWQALFFTALGMILSATMDAVRKLRSYSLSELIK